MSCRSSGLSLTPHAHLDERPPVSILQLLLLILLPPTFGRPREGGAPHQWHLHFHRCVPVSRLIKGNRCEYLKTRLPKGPIAIVTGRFFTTFHRHSYQVWHDRGGQGLLKGDGPRPLNSTGRPRGEGGGLQD